MIRNIQWLALVFWLAFATGLFAQQVPDSEFQPEIFNPAFSRGTGPVVSIDEAHHNFHTRDGRYAAFSRFLEADGYQVRRNLKTFENGIDESVDILVVANALHTSNSENWDLPNPSAFTEREIDSLEAWVRSGGSLFLIADHMPFPGAAGALADRFGIQMANGFAFVTDPGGEPVRKPIVFRKALGGLEVHPITEGGTLHSEVSQVISFTGQAFRVTSNRYCWNRLLSLPANSISLEPEVAWEFEAGTSRRDVSGWLQGACAQVGSGRIVIFGEAAMFTSQRAGREGRLTGMAAEGATGNQQLLSNIARWLSGNLGSSDLVDSDWGFEGTRGANCYAANCSAIWNPVLGCRADGCMSLPVIVPCVEAGRGPAFPLAFRNDPCVWWPIERRFSGCRFPVARNRLRSLIRGR